MADNQVSINLPTTPLEKMYETYFMDYASYVILERAVPNIKDGLKPVQRRILHAMRRIHDGRYHKVANIIGQTMQFHPHGDSAIGSALVNIGQKDLLIDPQGNWGDVRTGDSAAAARYIEARLTPFAMDILFNPDTTAWQLSYDGRNKEPVTFPAKFPLVLAQGVEGIAVGLSTKILPHNFIELIKASIKILKGRSVKIYPDFQTGGQIDVGDYQDGHRGGKVKVRAKIEKRSKNLLAITELPYSTTTTQVIDSILKANDRDKIKIKKVTDNTAKDVEILIELATGMSPDMSIDALYAFTNCEISISPNACLIVDKKPLFLNVLDLLHASVEQTKNLLGEELEIKKANLEEKWHFSSLEKIFIQERIYRDIEQSESWEEVLIAIEKGLHKYVKTPENKKPGQQLIELNRNINEEDIRRLTEIKIKRISKYNVFKADQDLAAILEELEKVKHDLAHLTEFTIAFYEMLLSKYGKGRERKTDIQTFGNIEARRVVVKNTKLYANLKEGFIGFGIKKDEFITDCSDIDDVIVFLKDGKFIVTRVAEKTFVGKNIIHVAVWKKGDERTTYNYIYSDLVAGKTYAKRFNVKAITRDKEYNLSNVEKIKTQYFSVNPNGESEIVEVRLSQGSRARNKKYLFDFEELAIKGRASKGNVISKYPVQRVVLKQKGASTIGNVKYWLDTKVMRMQTSEADTYVDAFAADDLCLAVYKDGSYELIKPAENRKLDLTNILIFRKYAKDKSSFSVIYYDGEKRWSVVKRFELEVTTVNQRYSFISEHEKSQLLYVSLHPKPIVQYSYGTGAKRVSDVVKIVDFIDIKGWKSLGNKLMDKKVKIGQELHKTKKVTVGETVELDINPQSSLFN